ncbi:S41 family peptidase [Cohnella endophytica]|uniref:S41 family peptidase n=1 Tax=Cohnella endophytica TaxID=2419778 RepID=UPI0013149BFD|nr:S41 family peptidase [Cohnella endophytica]
MRRTATGCILIAFMVFTSACAFSNDSPTDPVRMLAEKKIAEYNQSGYDLINQGDYERAISNLNVAIDEIYELEPTLKNLDKEVEMPELMDSPFNNLSWAYNEMGNYEESLKAIDKALLILPNTEYEYVNKGNALYGLNRGHEALESYEMAISVNVKLANAHYGKGMVLYDDRKYEEARNEFDVCLSLEANDFDAAKMKVRSLVALRQEEQAKAFADDLVAKNAHLYAAYEVKSAALAAIGNYEDTRTFYESMDKEFPDRLEAGQQLGDLYYDYGHYDQSLAQYKKLLTRHSDKMSVYKGIIKSYGALGDMDGALWNFKQATKRDTADAGPFVAMGDLYRGRTDYMEAVRYYDEALRLDSGNETIYIDKISALYNGKRNSECAAFGQEARQLSAMRSDLAWFTGQCELELGQYDEAIGDFKRAVEIDPNDHEALSSIARAYLFQGNDAQAKKYSDESLELSPDDSAGQFVKEALLTKAKPLGEQVRLFFGNNYLYSDEGDGGKKTKPLAGLDKAGLTTREIAEAVDRARKKDDPFTFTLYGGEYDQFSDGMESGVTYREEGNTSYIRVDSFESNTDDRFIEAIDRIPDPGKRTLVIDLRGNFGGLTDSANHMADALLPQVVVSTLIRKDGSTENYYSDASRVVFKKIAILVDENTASASELLTLSLKTYLNNVTVIGRNTFGKGVGQQVFEDKPHKLMVFVVNFYWNVRQTNIMGTGIKPDIYVKGDKLESFMAAV